jgi:hypothetical protein
MNTSSNNGYNSLDDIFGTESTDVVPTQKPSLPVIIQPEISTGDDIEDDYIKARKKLSALIDQGQEAIDGMLNVAKGSDSPRAYEVVGQLIKTTADTAKDLMDLQARKKKLQVEDDKPQKIETQNNIIFSGSTQDLLKALKAEKAKVINHE